MPSGHAMISRLGFSPVFVYGTVTAARRWQGYAPRVILLSFNRCMVRMNESPELSRFLKARRAVREPARPVVSSVEAS